ncbi:hypothetical protein B0H21DRAFT_220940 [Amylocystis lapponica]|nr:hypothetical protein B0H21DRAFT_220940 [Amylocystis lapponica]
MSICSFAALESLVSISRLPHILPHIDAVHQFSLDSNKIASSFKGSPQIASRHTGTARVRPFVHLVPLLLPQTLRTTRVLKISVVDWRTFPPRPSTRLHRSMVGSVTELTLSECSLGSCNEFVRFISSFSSLSNLCLGDVRWENQRPPGAAYRASPPVLKSLSVLMIRDEEASAFMEWTILQQTSLPLRHLSLEVYNPRVAIVRRIASVVGLQLEHLSLVIRPTSLKTYEPILTACPGLLSLDIEMYDALDQLARQLSLVTSRTLRNVQTPSWLRNPFTASCDLSGHKSTTCWRTSSLQVLRPSLSPGLSIK